MARKPTIRFELRPDKVDNKGLYPIRMIYQVHGQRKYFATSIKVLKENWNSDTQKAVFLSAKAAKKLLPGYDVNRLPTDSDITDFNNELDELRQDVGKIEKRFELDQVSFSAEMVIAALNKIKKPLTKKEEPNLYVHDFIKRYAAGSATTHRAGTIKAYNGLAAHVEGYEKFIGEKVRLDKTDITFLKGFQTYLANLKKTVNEDGVEKRVPAINNTTIAKQLSTLKTLFNQARVVYKLPVNNDYRDFKFTRKDSKHEVIVLTDEELQAVRDLDLSENKRLEKVRDVFVFSCATGLRFSDLAQLRREHLRGDMIKMSAIKTGQKLDIPLNSISAAVLDKYKDFAFPLPIISGQKTNQYLKEIGKMAKIVTPIEKVREYGAKRLSKVVPKYELMSIHMGRRTFATLSLEKGMAPQEVMSITGHSTYSSFKRYVDVSTERKKQVIHKAWGAPESVLKAV